jgi:hypothetical protein
LRSPRPVAAAVVNTSQQIGGSVGVAVLNTVAITATASRLRSGPHTDALIHGYAVAAVWAVAILLAGAMHAAVLVSARPTSGAVHERPDEHSRRQQRPDHTVASAVTPIAVGTVVDGAVLRLPVVVGWSMIRKHAHRAPEHPT